jgi:EAL domain-containing protein (putative c-di-GMP-specific phosphodiesterase class I)
MVAMAHQLNMTVVAEGVEHEEQLQLLREWGCDEFQGFLVAPPLRPDAFRSVLERHNTVRISESAEEGTLL